jgi:phosphopantothenoylcysteine decarboxylase / phosphopantothenate---cysteine ligase
VMSNVAKQDIFIGVAAVADYSPAKPSTQKIKKNEQALNIELTATKDILKDVASLPNAPFCVGFAAETENLIAHAEAKRKAKKLPLLVANLVGESMGLDEANITLLDNNGAHALPRADKAVLATEILTHICSLI